MIVDRVEFTSFNVMRETPLKVVKVALQLKRKKMLKLTLGEKLGISLNTWLIYDVLVIILNVGVILRPFYWVWCRSRAGRTGDFQQDQWRLSQQ